MVADAQSDSPDLPGGGPELLPCPRCGRLLECEGRLTFGCSSAVFYSYACDVCLDSWKVGDTVFERAYSFAVDAEGHLVCLDGQGRL